MKRQDEGETDPPCERCGTPLPPESRFCMECGTPIPDCGLNDAVSPDPQSAIGHPAKPAQPQSAEPEGLRLAQANLLRMRGRWEAAAAQCAEVLRRHPTSASAHSLLGDIYENQGRLEEAIHWYQAALELSPASVADQAKLARARELQRARAARRVERAPARRPPISWMRIATVAGVAFCCTILALAIIVSATDRGGVGDETESPDASGRASQAFLPRAFRRAPPVQTSRERQLLVALRGVSVSPAVTAGERPLLRPIALLLDPRGPSATLRLLLDPAPASSPVRGMGVLPPPGVGVQMQREVHRLAARLVQLEPSLTLVHAYVLVPMTDPTDRREPEPAFVATLEPSSLQTDAALTPDPELPSLFRDPWWGPPFVR
jgi:hypothetical protein